LVVASGELVETMSEAVRAFANGAEQSDDLTMLAIQYRGDQVFRP
jgi:serine phosphatase RsbU (regulator of sigma subunit)